MNAWAVLESTSEEIGLKEGAELQNRCSIQQSNNCSQAAYARRLTCSSCRRCPA